MRIPFSAYADDCTVTGEVSLEADRLSDLLATTEAFDVGRAAFQALDDGRVVEADEATIRLDDLCIVAATGPRGRLDRRLWTRQFPARARLGPYTVYGYLHGAPTTDPFKTADRRAIVAISSSVVEYDRCGTRTSDRAEAVLLNRVKIDVLEPVSEAELGPATRPEVATALDPRSKDMTGELFA
jgi:hypothetical protein